MNAPYTPDQRAALKAALARDLPVLCPACGAPVVKRSVEPGPGVPYVRHRVMLICTGCRRTASLDLPRDPSR